MHRLVLLAVFVFVRFFAPRAIAWRNRESSEQREEERFRADEVYTNKT